MLLCGCNFPPYWCYYRRTYPQSKQEESVMNKWKELEAFLAHEKETLKEQTLQNKKQIVSDGFFWSALGKETQTKKIIAFMDDLNRREKKENKEKRQYAFKEVLFKIL